MSAPLRRFAAALLFAAALAAPAWGHDAKPAGHAPAPRASGDPAPPADARALLFDERRALAYSQAAIGRKMGDHLLLDRDQKPHRLSEYAGKPLVVNFVYTSCGHTCPLIVQSLKRSVDIAADALGRDSFRVVTVGFDTAEDTPQRMRSYARAQGVDQRNWEFLSADAETMARFTADLGFIYAPIAGGFDHLAQVTVVDADGAVYRQVYGENLAPQHIVEPLKELVFGTRPEIGAFEGLLNRVRLLCTVYDPASDRYRFSYSIFFGLAIGFLSLVAMGGFLLRSWLGNARA